MPSYAPTTVKSHDGTVNGVYRNLFQHHAAEYGRRRSCETVNNGMKRTTGSVLRSRKQNTLFAEAALKVAAYAVRL